jgi:hypothetical protein
VLRAASSHYRSQQRLAVAAIAAVRSEWRRMGDDLDASWARVGPRIVALVTAAQVGAARDGIAYVPEALSEQRIRVKPEASVPAGAFAGGATSLDGLVYGSLDSLLYGAVIHARTAPAESLTQRLLVGRNHLDGLVQTQVADAGRNATAASITSYPGMSWTRMVSAPCCQRCAVLAGKVFKSNQGFKRHPRCDCTHIPTLETHWRDAGVFIGPDDVKDLTIAQRKAIADGADMNQVINAHRHGSRSKDLMTTREGSTKRGVAGKRLIEQGGSTRGTGRYSTARTARLTPKGIYEVAGDRDEALKLLKQHGYII